MNLSRKISSFLSALCVIALVWIGVAHRPIISSTTAPNVELSAYVFPDGTIPVICFGGEGDGKSTSSRGCEICTLANTIILPEPPQSFARTMIEIKYVGSVSKALTISKSIRLVGAPPTGPPLFSA